jgi:hypothetical protein
MVNLIEKARIPANALSDLDSAIRDPKAVLQNVAFDETIAMRMAEISRADVPDLLGSHYSGDGPFLRCPRLSRDGRIRSANVQTIW